MTVHPAADRIRQAAFAARLWLDTATKAQLSVGDRGAIRQLVNTAYDAAEVLDAQAELLRPPSWREKIATGGAWYHRLRRWLRLTLRRAAF